MLRTVAVLWQGQRKGCSTVPVLSSSCTVPCSQNASRLFFVSLVLLGITGIFNDTALFWVVLVAFLQRGPIAPQENEVSEPTEQAKVLGAATLVLGFLVYCPLPIAL